jgi:hypothetical protein
MRHIVKVSLVVALLVTSATVWAADGNDQARPEGGILGQVKVVTQNLYIGADIFRIFDAETPEDIPFVVAGILETVFETDFPERAEALADLIARTEPHLIGLQEVELVRFQSPGDFLIGNPQPAEDVLFDYLEILLDALETRGLDYVVAGIVENADIELPFFAGVGGGGQPLFDDIRLTDHDVILARADVATSNVTASNFEINIEFNIGGVDVVFYRGYVILDATVRGRTYRFANTHLEVASPVPQVQAAQMLELVTVLNDSPHPIILVGHVAAACGRPRSGLHLLSKRDRGQRGVHAGREDRPHPGTPGEGPTALTGAWTGSFLRPGCPPKRQDVLRALAVRPRGRLQQDARRRADQLIPRPVGR